MQKHPKGAVCRSIQRGLCAEACKGDCVQKHPNQHNGCKYYYPASRIFSSKKSLKFEEAFLIECSISLVFGVFAV